MNKPKPYIGVSAVTTTEEAQAVSASFIAQDITFESSHTPMVGFLLSREQPEDRPLSSLRYTELGSVSKLIGSVDVHVGTALHYETSYPESLTDDICALLETLSKNKLPSALQLNVEFFEGLSDSFKEIRRQYPDILLILQLRSLQLPQSIAQFGDSLDYILIDSSCGKGERVDTKRAIEMYHEIQVKMPEVTVGFAGGLSPENLDEILPALSKHIDSGFCIDAESQIRTKDDHLDLHRTDMYIARAAALLL
ncbi:hypothetical protein CL635_01895 [bacterium]|nr:hypothetical protein [bacterium]|tara:strand:- start:1798 stop:2553 length:756 start_codon:yes stop_codon:yes gene_type:complete